MEFLPSPEPITKRSLEEGANLQEPSNLCSEDVEWTVYSSNTVPKADLEGGLAYLR